MKVATPTYKDTMTYTNPQQCDEIRPKCSNCSNRQSDCEYSSSSSLLWANDGPSPRQSSSRSNFEETSTADLASASPFGILGRLSEDVAAAPSTSLNMMDLELLLQWCNSTHKSLTRGPRLDSIWRYLVTEEALSQPFLMHGLLALSALHLARTKRDNSATYISTAVAHQNQALALFRERLDDINPSNAKAMFAFSSIVVVYAFSSTQPSDSSDLSTSLDDLCQVLVLARGVQEVINKASSSLWESSFRPILRVDSYTPYLPDSARSALEQLREANRVCGTQDATHDTASYGQVIDNLSEEFSAVHGGFMSISVAGRWAIRVKPKYMESLRERRPLALVILVYYCALLHYLRQNWCLDEWGARASKAIWELLDDQWKELALWAMVEIFGQGFSEK